jgi:hypothetical protein
MTDQPDRDEAERLKALLNATARLPRSIEPPVDQWPGIRGRIDDSRVVPIRAGVASQAAPTVVGRRRRTYLVAAAAVMLIAGGVYLTRGAFYMSAPPLADTPAVAPAPAVTPAPPPATASPQGAARPGVRSVSTRRTNDHAHVMSAFDAYEDAARDLSTSLNARRSQLDPKTLAVLDTCMKQIDKAINEARAALGRNPGNEIVTDFLRSSYRQKIDLLKRTVEGPRRTL